MNLLHALNKKNCEIVTRQNLSISRCFISIQFLTIFQQIHEHSLAYLIHFYYKLIAKNIRKSLQPKEFLL